MKYRNPIVVALLTLITFGIYGIYWLYKTRLEIVGRNSNPASIPRLITLFLPIIALFAVIPLVAMIDLVEGNANIIGTAVGILFCTVCIIVAIVIPFWWFYKYCMATAKVTKRTEGSVLYVLWVVCWLAGFYIIWPAIVQNDLNKLAAKPTTPDAPYPPHHPPTTQPPSNLTT